MPRRPLDFTTFQQFRDDVVNLSQGNYTRAGKWSLGQIADHMSKSLEMSMDGLDAKAPFFLRLMGPVAKRVVLWRRRMPRNIAAPKELLPPQSASDDAASVERLLNNIDRYTSLTTPLKPSPLMGNLTRDEWDQIHLIHAGHHLSFLSRVD